MPVWRKIRRGPYLYFLGVVGCLAALFGLGEWDLELVLAVLLLLIMLYMAKDITVTYCSQSSRETASSATSKPITG